MAELLPAAWISTPFVFLKWKPSDLTAESHYRTENTNFCTGVTSMERTKIIIILIKKGQVINVSGGQDGHRWPFSPDGKEMSLPYG